MMARSPRASIYALALGISALAGCGKKESAPPPSAASPAATAPADGKSYSDTGSDLSPATRDMADCSAAIAAAGHVDPTSRTPDMKNPGFTRYMQMMSKTIDSSSSQTGVGPSNEIERRYSYWKGQPGATQSARATACGTKFGV